MLQLTKHTDPNRTILTVSALLLEHLQRKRVESFSELRIKLLDRAPGNEPLFVLSLNLLFALGLIEYRPKTDAFEYVGP